MAKDYRCSRTLLLTLVLLNAAAARADWHRVETDRFLVYDQGSDKVARFHATRLTVFDRVLRRFNPRSGDEAPVTKLQIYLVDNEEQLRQIVPNIPTGMLGIYVPTHEGLFAIAVKSTGFGADDVLFHEYAHHFMLENFSAAYPAWFVEGWAEYFATTEIRREEVRVGGYNRARARDIQTGPRLALADVLSKSTADIPTNMQSAFYAESWLLMHYMRSSPERAAQLDVATAAIARGAPPVEAFENATGKPLEQLTRELRDYDKLQIIVLKDIDQQPPPMRVTTLPASAETLLLDGVRLALWNPAQPDPEFLARVRQEAAKFPDDRLAQTTLARAEFTLGDVAAGEAIVRARLAADPQDAEDQFLAGDGQLLAGLRDEASAPERFRAARLFFSSAYKLNGQDFRVLYGYALSRTTEPDFPTDNDVTALLEASGLAPSVMETRWLAGHGLVTRRRTHEAASILAPLLNDPHGSELSARARKLLESEPEQDLAAEDSADPGLRPPLDPPHRAIMRHAAAALEAGDTAAAAAALATLELESLAPFERSQVERLLAGIDTAGKDFASARLHWQTAIDTGGLTEIEEQTARKQIARLLAEEAMLDARAAR